MKFIVLARASMSGAEEKLPTAIEVPYLWSADNELVSVSWERAAKLDRRVSPQRSGVSSRQNAA